MALANGNTSWVRSVPGVRITIVRAAVLSAVHPGLHPTGAIAGTFDVRKCVAWLDGSWMDRLPRVGTVAES